MEMVNIPMLEDGPDMQKAAELAAADSCIKAIWCVPKYANPTGNTYSASTVRALADLPNRAAAEDFVVLWDNAYAVHHLQQPGDALASIRDAAIAAGTRAYCAVRFYLKSHLRRCRRGFCRLRRHRIK